MLHKIRQVTFADIYNIMHYILLAYLEPAEVALPLTPINNNQLVSIGLRLHI